MSDVKAFLVCPGLGHISRGFETFTRECFDVLKDTPGLDLRLFKGAGPDGPGERRVFTLLRTSRSASMLGKVLRKGDYGGEAISFGVSLLPYLLKERPDVVFFSDWFVGKLLRIWRQIFGLDFKLVLSNGGPFDPERFCWDHVQQVSPQYLEQALAAGVPADAQTLLPLGHDIDREFTELTDAERRELRLRLNLRTDRPILLSVGAVRRGGHKRMEYLFSEVVRMPQPRPFLVVLGEREEGAEEMAREATHALGTSGFSLRTVPKPAVNSYYRAADLFALCSLREGFGRVFVEAMAQGLRCVTHDHPTARYVLGNHGVFGDLQEPGALARIVSEQIGMRVNGPALHRSVYERFSWDKLGPQYVDMLVSVARRKRVRAEAPRRVSLQEAARS